MKKTKLISLIIIAIILLSCMPLKILAEETYTEIFVTKEDIEKYGQSAIQSALNEANINATEKNPYKIIVESGEYTLNTALRIYSNTYLYLDGVYFTRSENAKHNMIRTGMVAETESAEGYNAFVNITIDGGVFDANYTSGNTVVKAGHATNFTIKNATIMNVKNAHLIEFAGIDGLTVDNCTIKNQAIDADIFETLKMYEAIQLDILEKETHFSGFREEDLPMKNVVINACKFSNCPRAVGSHTAVYNAPLDNIKITNCEFDDMKNAAIQSFYWNNIEISGNKITNSPRGIAIYSAYEDGTGFSTAEELSALGGTTNHVNNNVYTTGNHDNNIIIKNNYIYNGTVEDTYSNKFTKAAITVYGEKIDSSKKFAGDYYIKNPIIENNEIITTRYGIMIKNNQNAQISKNTITYDKYKDTQSTTNAYSIFVFSNSKNANIKNNIVKKAKTAGVYIQSSSANEISGNTITESGTDGIFMTGEATANKIISNTIKNGNAGIHLSNSKVDNIEKNRISNTNYGIQVYTKSLVKNIASNTMTSIYKKSLSITSDSTALMAPTVKVSNSSTGVKVEWNKIYSATGYIIYRKTGSGSYSQIAKVTSLSYIDKKAKNGTAYTYAVCSYKGSNNSARASKSITFLSQTKIRSAKNSYKKAIKVTWYKNNSATGYEVKYKLGSKSKTLKITKKTTVSTTIKKLTKKKKYTIYVRAYKTVGTTKYYSAWSPSKTILVKK